MSISVFQIYYDSQNWWIDISWTNFAILQPVWCFSWDMSVKTRSNCDNTLAFKNWMSRHLIVPSANYMRMFGFVKLVYIFLVKSCFDIFCSILIYYDTSAFFVCLIFQIGIPKVCFCFVVRKNMQYGIYSKCLYFYFCVYNLFLL